MLLRMLKNGVMLVILLCFCVSTQAQKIGFLMDSYVDDRWQKDTKHFTDHVDMLGGEVITKLAKGNHATQLAQAQELIDEGVKVFVIVAVDGKEASAIVDLAEENGIPTLAYDRMITNANLDMYLSYDNVKVGALQAQSAVDENASGKFILINGPVSDHNAIKFREGQLSVLDPLVKKGKITIKDDIVLDDWGEVNAFVSILDVFDDMEDVSAILAANDGIAMAVASAVNDVEVLKEVFLTGQDADLGALQNIMKGYQNMTVYKPIAPMAKLAAEKAVALANGKDTKDKVMEIAGIKVKSILLDPIEVNSSNMKNTVLADGHVSADDFETGQ
ncbi:MAG: substrate-binding domain-containing protein [Cyclobacteriaceae bacterium]